MSNTSAGYQCAIKNSCPNLANSTKFVFDEVDSTCASVFSSLLAIIGTGLNLVVIVSLLNYPRTRRNTSTPYMISLCLLDLVYSFFILPIFSAKFAMRNNSVPIKFCKFFPVVFYGIIGATIINIAVVAIKNAIRMWSPDLAEKILTNTVSIMGRMIPINSILIILFCWTLPVALVLPSYLNGKTGLIEETGSCTFIPNSDDDCSNLGETLLYSIGFGIPSGLILLSYLAIFVKVETFLKI